MNTTIRTALATLLGTTLVISTAYGADLPEDHFQQGLTAFKAENYRNALHEFELAQKAGLRRPSLDSASATTGSVTTTRPRRPSAAQPNINH